MACASARLKPVSDDRVLGPRHDEVVATAIVVSPGVAMVSAIVNRISSPLSRQVNSGDSLRYRPRPAHTAT
jgi:hypothetical protein